MIADYTVIRSAVSGDGAKEAMSQLRSALGENAKPPATDWVNERRGEVIPQNNMEILIGDTNHASSIAAMAAGLNYPITAVGAKEGFDAIVTADMDTAAYTVEVTDTGITIRAGHYLALEQALKELLSGKGLDGTSFSGTYAGNIPLTDGDMVPVWNDEFDGDTLDGSRWTPTVLHGSLTVHSSATIRNSPLNIRLHGFVFTRSRARATFSTTLITNNDTLTQGEHIYYGITAFLPSGTG